jgi:hypothetical protein
VSRDDTRQRSLLCRVPTMWHSAKKTLCRVPTVGSRQRLTVVSFGTAVDGPLPRAPFAECLTLGKLVFAEWGPVPSVQHSVKGLFAEGSVSGAQTTARAQMHKAHQVHTSGNQRHQVFFQRTPRATIPCSPSFLQKQTRAPSRLLLYASSGRAIPKAGATAAPPRPTADRRPRRPPPLRRPSLLRPPPTRTTQPTGAHADLRPADCCSRRQAPPTPTAAHRHRDSWLGLLRCLGLRRLSN